MHMNLERYCNEYYVRTYTVEALSIKRQFLSILPTSTVVCAYLTSWERDVWVQHKRTYCSITVRPLNFCEMCTADTFAKGIFKLPPDLKKPHYIMVLLEELPGSCATASDREWHCVQKFA